MWLSDLWMSVLAHESKLIQALHDDLGKPREEVHLQEIFPLKAEIKHARRHVRGWMAPKPAHTSLAMLGTRAYVHPLEPKGHVLVISPWNFPVILTLRPLVSACSRQPGDDQTQRAHPRDVEGHPVHWSAKALPQEAATVVLGGPEVSAHLTSLRFQHICFTGRNQHWEK